MTLQSYVSQKCIEEGEMNTLYFSNLREDWKAVASLLITKVKCRDTKTIEKDFPAFFVG